MKTSTAILVGCAILATGGLAYFFIFRKNDDVPVIAGPNQIGSPVNAQLLTQPSQQYPVTGPTPQRQDTASEPWSATKLPANSAGLASGITQQAQDLAAGASITSSLTSIWDDLDIGSWWSSTDASVVEDDSTEMDWSSYLGW